MLYVGKKLLIIILSFITGFIFLSNEIHAATFTRGVFLQKITPNSVDMRWVTDTKETLIVKYGTTTSYGSQVTSDTEQSANCGGNICTGGPNNHARVTGLSSNTKYYYQVTTSSGGALTPAGDLNYYFKTAPTTGSSTPFTWAIWGDSGSSGTVNADDLLVRKPDLLLVAGDIGYPYSTDFNNNNNQYFNVYRDVMKFSPFYPTCGNHETSCPTVMADHSLPGGGNMGNQISTYSWDWGNVHFVALNANGSYAYNPTNPALSDPQIRWAYDDLRGSSQPWKVVFWHQNGWSQGSHATNPAIVSNMVRMASDAGADLVVYGHSHVFERWDRKVGFYPNLQVYTIGNGGKKSTTACTSTSPGPGCLAKSNGESGFLFAEVNGNQMTVKYITQTGTNPDTITINSDGPGPTTTPSGTPTATPGPTSTPVVTNTPTSSPSSSPNPTSTPIGGNGDACGNGGVNAMDIKCVLNKWLLSLTNFVDQFSDGKINSLDFSVVAKNIGIPNSSPTPSSPPGQYLDNAMCNPDLGPAAFTTNITNQYLPFSTGYTNDRYLTDASSGFQVRMRILSGTKSIPGADGLYPIQTRILEEFETQNGNWVETSYNWFAQTVGGARPGTVCYFGEDVCTPGSPPPNCGAGGSWEAGNPVQARAGIMMPAGPLAVGMNWLIEDAACCGAYENGRVEQTGITFTVPTTPSTTFNNVIYIVEDNGNSNKRYAPGVGMISDEGALLTGY